MFLKIKFEQPCSYYGAHLYTFASDLKHPTSAVIIVKWQKRFPGNLNFISFSITTKQIFESSQICINKIVVSDIPSWKLQNPVIDCTMFLYCRNNDNRSFIRSNFLYTIYNDFTLIYTNGSKSLLGTSSALFIPNIDKKKSISFRKNSSVIFAELNGILSALRWVSLNRHRKIVILILFYRL